MYVKFLQILQKASITCKRYKLCIKEFVVMMETFQKNKLKNYEMQGLKFPKYLLWSSFQTYFKEI